MNTEYFKEQICEELCGAKSYAKLAIENKIDHPEWSKMFLEMSGTELEHASYLMKMFNEFYNKMGSKNGIIPQYIEDAHTETSDEFASKYAKVKYLHEAYSKL